MCKCTLCTMAKLQKAAALSTDIEFVRESMTKFFDLWTQESEENGYKAAILDGSWPQSVEILTERLENAKKLRNNI